MLAARRFTALSWSFFGRLEVCNDEALDLGVGCSCSYGVRRAGGSATGGASARPRAVAAAGAGGRSTGAAAARSAGAEVEAVGVHVVARRVLGDVDAGFRRDGRGVDRRAVHAGRREEARRDGEGEREK